MRQKRPVILLESVQLPESAKHSEMNLKTPVIVPYLTSIHLAREPTRVLCHGRGKFFFFFFREQTEGALAF